MALMTLASGRSVWYAERPNSPQESYTGGQGKAKRIFDVLWEDRLSFLAGVLGWSEPVFAEDGTFRYIKRIPPLPYPPVSVRSLQRPWGIVEATDYWLYATAVESIEPVGVARPNDNSVITQEGTNFRMSYDLKDENEMFKHTYARLTISYDSLPYRPSSDSEMIAHEFVTDAADPDESYLWRYVSRTIQPHAEHLTLPFGRLFWNNDAPGGLAGQMMTNQTGKIIPTMEVVFTWHQVPGFPEQAYKLQGCINSEAISDYSPSTGRVWTYEPGTLLFTNMEVRNYRMATGIYCNDVVYRFKYFSAIEPHTGNVYSPARGHNYFLAFHNSVGVAPNNYCYSYQKLQDQPAGGGRGVYQEADLRQLFTLPNL